MSPGANRNFLETYRTLLHELNEALTAIENYAAGAERLARAQGGEDPGRIAEALQRLIGQVQRAADAVRRLRSLPGSEAAGKEGKP